MYHCSFEVNQVEIANVQGRTSIESFTRSGKVKRGFERALCNVSAFGKFSII